MKRLGVEPTEEELRKSIELDSAGRNQDIVDFIKMLADTEGPYSYMIDAAWGDGKTFFVKSVILILEMLGKRKAGEMPESGGLKTIIGKMEGVDATFLPFYFNAWSNDFADDPIIALLANMAVEFERYGLLRESKASEIVAAIVDAGLTFAGVPVKASSIVDSLTGKSVVDAYVDRAKTRSRIDQLCNDVLSKKADKIIVVIDELDRCRPDFAVHLLEQTKSLFASSNVIFVFATDSSQLAKAVGGVYGSGFDTTHFLERFFDERVTMTPVDSYAFTHDGRPLPSGFRFDNLVSEVYSSRVFTIRDSFRIKEKLDAARLHCAGSQYDDLPHLVAQQTVLPLLIIIEHDDMELFRRITSGADPDAMFEYGQQYSSFIENISCFVEHSGGNGDQRCSLEDCKKYMHDLCVVIYGSNRQSDEYRDAQDSTRGYESFDSRVYCQLKFES